MKRGRLTIIGMIVVGLLLGAAPGVWAVGSPAGETPCCQVINPGVGAQALKGTMAIVYTPGDIPNLDVTLRLEKNGIVHFFRLNIFGDGANISGLTNEEIACLVLNPFELPSSQSEIRTRVTAFVNAILSAFFVGLTADNTRLAITGSSISKMQGVFECEAPPPAPDGNSYLCLIPDAEPPRVSTIGDIVIYAVDKDRLRLERSGCE
jgi:hypothetical protein